MATRSDSVPAAAVTVRAATPADAPQIARLSGQLGYPTTPEEAVQRLAQLEGDARHAVYVAESAPSQVVGWIHVEECRLIESDTRAEINGLVVDERHRSRGAGRILMEHAEQWARARGCRAVVLRSNVIRTRAHAFYQELGYQTLKTQKYFRKNL
jgi:ribosomal protein S18 acetylase RimI-like enzyme